MPDEFNKLVEQEARVRRASRMVPTEGPLSDQKRHEIRSALVALMEEHGLTQADVGKAIGRNTTYLNNLLNKAATIPAATRDEMWREINQWLDREARARETRRPDDFVLTRVAGRMIALAERLTERADMAICYGMARPVSGKARFRRPSSRKSQRPSPCVSITTAAIRPDCW